jgi:hypothetical protein
MLHMPRGSAVLWPARLVRRLGRASDASDGKQSSHVYCFECIMKWRASGKEREAHSASAQCPSCRLVTKLVVPSKVFEPAGPAKDAIIQAYKDSKKAIPCRNFDKAVAAGRLFCPFGTDCLYSHKVSLFRFGSPSRRQCDRVGPRDRRGLHL